MPIIAKGFTPSQLEYQALQEGSLSYKQKRAAYTQLRDIAQKRIKRLAREFSQSETYKQHKEGIRKLRDIKTESQLNIELAKLNKLIQSPYSTITGQKNLREQALETLKSNKYYKPGTTEPIVTEENYDRFTDFMEAYRADAEARVYGSETPTELFNEAERLKIKPKSLIDYFSYWVDHLEDLKNMENRRGTREVSASYIRRRLGLETYKEYYGN